MNDILGIFNFKNFQNRIIDESLLISSSFEQQRIERLHFASGDVVFEKSKAEDYFYSDEKVHIFIFGDIFSNHDYFSLVHQPMRILAARDLNYIYKKYHLELTKYTKGNFCIIIFDEEKNELFCISSKLNTLPLFYHFKDDNFIFSSSAKAIARIQDISAKINEKAFVEQILFYYPLADRTYFEGIFQLQPASILQLSRGNFKITKYWSIENILNNESKVISEKDALCQCISLMKENLKLITSDSDKFLLALTGGFDTRCNLALLEEPSKSFLCYSYGLPGSKQIEIPKIIAKKLSLDYQPIYLANEFEERYEEYALKALDFSGGAAPILRANFPYAFERLSKFSKINITGLFGSEIIKPFSLANEQVNQEIIDLFMDSDFDKAFNRAVIKIKQTDYIKSHVIDKYIQEIKEDFKEKYIQRLKSFDKIARFYIFLLEEAIRKYFMQEIMIERHYVNTLTPYFDEEFLELIFKTPFAGIYKGAGKKDIFSRRNSQLFYAKIIQRVKPALGDIITDRGYKPKDLLLPFILRAFKILPLYSITKIKDNIKGNDTFNPEQWPRSMLEKYIYNIGKNDDIFTDRLIRDFRAGFNLKENFRFFSIFSLRLWLHLLRNNP